MRRYDQAHGQQAVVSKSATEDVVEISSLARLLSQEDQAQPVRWELVEKAKTEIASGSYDSTDKIDQMIDRLMSDLQS